MQKKTKMIVGAAKSLGHVPKCVAAGYMCDQYVCSCGWESPRFFDGLEYAKDEWLKHAEKVIETGQAYLDFE